MLVKQHIKFIRSHSFS